MNGTRNPAPERATPNVNRHRLDGLVHLAFRQHVVDDALGLELLAGFLVAPLVDEDFRLLLELLFGLDQGLLLGGLLVLAGLVPPPDVLVRGLVQVVLDVRERVLRDVREAAPGVLPGLALVLVWDVFSDQQLDKGRLAGPVRAEEGHAAGQGDLHRDAGDGGDDSIGRIQ